MIRGVVLNSEVSIYAPVPLEYCPACVEHEMRSFNPLSSRFRAVLPVEVSIIIQRFSRR